MKAPQAPIHDQRGASRQPLHQRHARRLDRQTPYLGFSRGGAGGLPEGSLANPIERSCCSVMSGTVSARRDTASR